MERKRRLGTPEIQPNQISLFLVRSALLFYLDNMPRLIEFHWTHNSFGWSSFGSEIMYSGAIV